MEVTGIKTPFYPVQPRTHVKYSSSSASSGSNTAMASSPTDVTANLVSVAEWINLAGEKQWFLICRKSHNAGDWLKSVYSILPKRT